MSSISSVASADLVSVSSEPGCAPSLSAKSIPSVAASSQGIGPAFRSIATSEGSPPNSCVGMVSELMSSLADSPAPRPATPQRSRALVRALMEKTLADGLTISDLCEPCGPFGSLSKIRQASIHGPVPLRLVWRGLATEFSDLNDRLSIVAHLISENECSLLPTPCASDGSRGMGSEMHARLMRSRGLRLQEELGVRPGPEVIEWMMGFPIGWTELVPSETPSCRSSQSKSDGKS